MAQNSSKQIQRSQNDFNNLIAENNNIINNNIDMIKNIENHSVDTVDSVATSIQTANNSSQKFEIPTEFTNAIVIESDGTSVLPFNDLQLNTAQST